MKWYRHTWVVSLPRGDCLSHRGTFWIIYSDHWKFWSALGVSVQCHDIGASASPGSLLNRWRNPAPSVFSAPGLLWHCVQMLCQAQGPAGAHSRAGPWLVVLQQYLRWPPWAPSQRPAVVLPSAASSLAPCLPCSAGKCGRSPQPASSSFPLLVIWAAECGDKTQNNHSMNC